MVINDKESALRYIDALSGESLDTVYKHLSRAIDDQLICISLCRDNMHETIARHREAIAALSCAMVWKSVCK